MPYFESRRRVPFARPDVFDIVADIERYPEFIPGYRAARIIGRDGHRLQVEQEIGLGGWAWRFRTEATLSRPARITIHTRETPFSHLDQVWRFEEAADGGTEVVLEVDYGLRSPLLRGLVTRLFDQGFRQTVWAFERRMRARLETPRDRG